MDLLLKRRLRNAKAFCFDVDSTVITEEGLDELARYVGKYDIIKTLTSRAMGGNISFPDALQQRLDIIQPTQEILAEFVQNHEFSFSNNFLSLYNLARELGKDVFFVSGGLQSIVEPIARSIDLPLENIFTNDIIFDESGNYLKFDESRMNSRDDGKVQVIRHLKSAFGYDDIVMFGDGVTDMETKDDALFIAYFGVITRKLVQENSPFYIEDFKEIIDILSIEEE